MNIGALQMDTSLTKFCNIQLQLQFELYFLFLFILLLQKCTICSSNCYKLTSFKDAPFLIVY
jgi:hypothetical protein